MADKALTIIIRGKDAGGIALIDRVGSAIDKQRTQFAKIRVVQDGLYSGSMKMLAAGAAVGGGLIYLAKQAGTYEQGLRKVNTMEKLGEAGLQRLSGQMREVLRDKDILAFSKEATMAQYCISSVGLRGAAGLQTLKASAIGATAGMTDLSGVASDVTDLMNAYSEKSGPAAMKFMDQLWASVEVGKYQLADLNNEIGEMAAMGKAAGVGSAEILAATAVLTRKGLDVAMATTSAAGSA